MVSILDVENQDELKLIKFLALYRLEIWKTFGTIGEVFGMSSN